MSLTIKKPKPDLRVQQLQNGGWVVSEAADDPRCFPVLIGAFSNTYDMLAALHAALLTDDREPPVVKGAQ